MPARRTLSALAAVASCLVPAMVAATPASATTAPWSTDTVFVAATGQRYGGDGGVIGYGRDGTSVSYLSGGSAEDVAVDGDGTVYWVTCSGDVRSFNPNTGPVALASGLDCPDAVAVEPSGKVLVSDFYNLYEMNADGTGRTTLETGQVFSSIAVDQAGDIYAVDGGQYLEVRVAGSSSFVRTSGLALDGGLRSVRLDANNDLVVAESTHVAVLSLSGTAPTEYGAAAYANGAAVNQAGDLWLSDLKDDPGTLDQVDLLPAVGSPSVLATGIDYPRGMAVYPAVVPAARSASTVTVAKSHLYAHRRAMLTATVDDGAATDGLVQFAIDGNPVNDAATVSSGTASTLADMPKGPHIITATYLGSTTENPSQSAPLPYRLPGLTSTLVLDTATTTNPQADPVHVSAHVTGQHGLRPTGEVSFYVNNHYVSSAELNSSGHASATLELAPGTSTVTAKYGGDQVFNQSSDALDLTAVAPYASTTSADVRYGDIDADGKQHIVLAVTVTGQTGEPRPTGTVAVGTFTCTALVPGRGVRQAKSTCSADKAPGYYNLAVSYVADMPYASSHTRVSFYAGGGGG